MRSKMISLRYVFIFLDYTVAYVCVRLCVWCFWVQKATQYSCPWRTRTSSKQECFFIHFLDPRYSELQAWAVSARPCLEYLLLILFTNSNFSNAVIYPGRHPPNPHTLGYTTHIWIDCRPSLCSWPSPHVNMSAQTASYSACVPAMEYSKSYAN